MDREHSRTQIRIWAIINLIGLILFVGLKVSKPEKDQICGEDEATCACEDAYDLFDLSSLLLLLGMILYFIWRIHIFFFAH